jgi:hypothetical protein
VLPLPLRCSSTSVGLIVPVVAGLVRIVEIAKFELGMINSRGERAEPPSFAGMAVSTLLLARERNPEMGRSEKRDWAIIQVFCFVRVAFDDQIENCFLQQRVICLQLAHILVRGGWRKEPRLYGHAFTVQTRPGRANVKGARHN